VTRLVLLDATAELDEILVGVHHAPLERLRRPRIVSTIIQGDPAALIFFQLTYCWPGQSTAHALNLSPQIHVLGDGRLERMLGRVRNARPAPPRKARPEARSPEAPLDYTPGCVNVKERPSEC